MFSRRFITLIVQKIDAYFLYLTSINGPQFGQKGVYHHNCDNLVQISVQKTQMQSWDPIQSMVETRVGGYIEIIIIVIIFFQDNIF